MKIHVGQQLYWVPSQPYAYSKGMTTVTKVGRKWAELDNRYRIDIRTMVADGGGYSSPGRCYQSQEEHERIVEEQRTWSTFRDKIANKYRCPDGITTEKIREAAKVLGINLDV